MAERVMFALPRSFFLALLAMLAGCTAHAPVADPMNKNVVIFVPGLYGTELRDARTGALRWPAMTEILFRRRPLAVCAPAGTPPTACDAMVAGDIVKSVSVVPGLYRIDVYGKTLAQLQQSLGGTATVRVFAYDWRMDVSAQAAALDRMVDAERSKGHHVSIIAHSLGGLVVSYYLRYGPQAIEQAKEDWSGAAKLDKVVLAGVPYGGSVLSFVDLAVGRAAGPNRVMFDKRSYQSFSATYELLPAGDDKVLDGQFNSLNASLLDADVWQQNGWGAFAPDGDAARARAQLQRARLLRERLQAPVQTPPPAMPLLVVQGEGRRTLEKIVWRADESGQGHVIHDKPTWERVYGRQSSRRALYADGDTVVTLAASQLPASWQGFHPTELRSPLGHRDLLLDGAVNRQVTAFLQAR